MTPQPNRDLLWIPIVHTQVDQGRMGETIRRLYVREKGRRQWERHLRAIDAKWRGIAAWLDGLDLDYASVVLYQDGLPVCGREADIVKELADAGSQNHRLLMQLQERGARLMGTESPELLLEEYELARQVLISLESHQGSASARNQQERGKSLLEQRDRYIARRIAETLQPAETGLLFLGALHSFAAFLPQDIALQRVDHAVPGG